MTRFIYATAMVAVITLCSFSMISTANWKISNKYSIKFTSKEPSGIFKKMHGSILFNKSDLDHAKFNLSVDVNSINTGNGMKNKHAISEEYLNAAKYPKITFKSTRFNKKDNKLSVTGNLKLHGIEKKITVPFTFSNNIFKGSFTVNRLEYGIGGTKGMQAKVAKNIKISFSIPVTK